jgi:putative YhbY family RNA-binding protein
MLELSPHERRALRAKAHHLHPVVTIGQHGLTPTVLTEIDLALNAHGLIKVRVFLDDRDERELLLVEIADGLDAAPVQHIGKLFVLWRPQPEPAAEPAKVPRPKRGKTPTAKAREADRKATQGPERVARRARGVRVQRTGAYDPTDRPPAKRPRGPRTTEAPPATSPRGARKPQTVEAAATRPPRTPDRAAPRGPSAPNPRRRRTTR